MTELVWPETPWCVVRGDEITSMTLECDRCGEGSIMINFPVPVDEGTKYMHLFCTNHKDCKEKQVKAVELVT